METKYKTCIKCGTKKTIENFYKKKDCRDGLLNVCKLCFCLQTKEYYKNNPEKLKAINKRRYIKNRGSSLELSRSYYINNRDKILKRATEYRMNNPNSYKEYYINNRDYLLNKAKQYAKDNPEIILKRNKEYYLNNKQKENERSRIWKKNNKEKVRSGKNQLYHDKYKYDGRYKIDSKMALGIRKALQRVGGSKNGMHWEKMVGYTRHELEQRLIDTMPIGYDWNDFISGKLHIDHKRPKSLFEYTTHESIEFKKCWALSNLQLLTKEENIKKGNKIHGV